MRSLTQYLRTTTALPIGAGAVAAVLMGAPLLIGAVMPVAVVAQAAANPDAACAPATPACAPACAPAACAPAACAPACAPAACGPCSPAAGVATSCAVPGPENPCAACAPVEHGDAAQAAACAPANADAACAPAMPAACKPCMPACAPAAYEPAKAACAPEGMMPACAPANPDAACAPATPAKAVCAPANPEAACAPCAAAPAACAPACAPCAAAAMPELTDEQAQALYDCVRGSLADMGWSQGEWDEGRMFLEWENFTTAPYISTTHGSRYAVNYANPVAAEQYGRYEQLDAIPEGGIIAKPTFTVSKEGMAILGPLFLMEKAAAGALPDSTDWIYTTINADGSVVGRTGGVNGEAMESCASCHMTAGAEADDLFFLPEAYRR